MHVLVTGGSGYIGKILIRRLLDLGHFVVSVDIIAPDNKILDPHFIFIKCDILDINSIKGQYFDAVIHLAAEKNVKICEENKDFAYKVNVLGTKSILEFCTLNNIKKVIFASTAGVYGPSHYPVDEDSEICPNNNYGKQKYECECLLKEWSKKDPLISVTILRFFNVVGVDSRNDLDENPILGENLFCIILRKLIGADPSLLYIHKYDDSSTPYRDFVNVKDIITAIGLILSNNESNGYEVYNISTGESHDIQYVVDNFERLSTRKILKDYMRVPDYIIPISKCKPFKFLNRYGFIPGISLLESIQESIAFYDL